MAEAEQTGWFQPAHSPGRVRLSEKRVDAWRRFGFPAELMDAGQSERMLGTRFWHGGMFNPTGGHINPLGSRPRAGQCRRGARRAHLRDSPVTTGDWNSRRWQVETERGSVRARALVLATNTYTDAIVGKLAPRLSRTIVPVLSWQMSTEPLGDNIRATVLPGRQAVSDTRG